MNRVQKIIATLFATVATFCYSVLAFAETETANAELVSAATSAAESIRANITAVIPIALGLLGLTMAIRIGIRAFKSLTNQSTSNR